MDSFYLTDAIRKAVDTGIPIEKVEPKLDDAGISAYINYKMEKAAGPEKVKRMDAERYKRSAKKWNYIINCVNSREKPTIKLTESEQFDYECMAAEKDAVEAKNRAEVESGKAKRFCPLIFENVETEW